MFIGPFRCYIVYMRIASLSGSLALAFIAGCGSVKAAQPDSGIDIDARISPTIDAGVSACTPSTVRCSADVLVTCGDDGTVAAQEECVLGCFDDERCAQLDPSNNLAEALDSAATAGDVVLAEDATINTTTQVIEGANGVQDFVMTVDSSGPVEVLILQVKSLTAGDITVVGERALAIVADGDISLSGTLSVNAINNQRGAGAMMFADQLPCQGKLGGGDVPSGPAFGGGGGGFGTAGGIGGGALANTSGNVDGNAELSPLRGGCAGGYGGDGDSSGPRGTPNAMDAGAGGGAVQLVSNTTITLASGASIQANGGGAVEDKGFATLDCFTTRVCFPGHGGGSGGGILLEAPRVEVIAGTGVFANGGGASCNSYNTSGEDGHASSQPALGATCSTQNKYGSGGNGATSVAAIDGVLSTSAVRAGGGGGGGSGRIRINLPVGSSFTPQGDVSPAASVGVLGVR